MTLVARDLKRQGKAQIYGVAYGFGDECAREKKQERERERVSGVVNKYTISLLPLPTTRTTSSIVYRLQKMFVCFEFRNMGVPMNRQGQHA